MTEDTTEDKIIVAVHVDPEPETKIIVRLSNRNISIPKRLVQNTEPDIVMKNVVRTQRISRRQKPGGRNANNANIVLKATIRISILKVWMKTN